MYGARPCSVVRACLIWSLKGPINNVIPLNCGSIVHLTCVDVWPNFNIAKIDIICLTLYLGLTQFKIVKFERVTERLLQWANEKYSLYNLHKHSLFYF